MKKLKVLMLTRLFPNTPFPTLGTFCLERASALAEHADLRVMVPTPYFPRWLPALASWRMWGEVEHERELDGGVRVTYPRYLSIPKFGTFSQGIAMAHSVYHDFKAHYGDWQPDIIDGHFAFPDGYAAVSLGQKIGCPTVVTCHGADLRVYPRHLGVKSMLGWVLRSADRVVSVSSALRLRSMELGCPEQKTVFLGNGVDPAKFALRSKTECRELLGLPQDRKIGVYVGYLIDRKNQSLIIRAMDEIRQRMHIPPLLALVGDGPNRERLGQETTALGLTDHVIFAGQRPHEEVALWMGSADWLLLSSDYEGWPTVYFEAMACGRPVLTSNVSSAKDAICKPDYGCVIEPCTPEAFAHAIIEASNIEYDALSIRAYAEEHSWAHWSAHAMAIFDQVIAEKRPSGGINSAAQS